MNKIKLSVAIAVFNEEENIERCLVSVKNIADEIIVVDGGSTDKTVKISKSFGAKVIETDNPAIFHINKNKAIDACQGNWILQLDADEVVSKELGLEIKKIIELSNDEISLRNFDKKKQKLFKKHQSLLEARDGKFKENGDIVAFFVARKNFFLGRFLEYGGVYPDGVIRLFKRGKARLPAKDVHEQFEVNGRVSWLENDLLHFADPNFSRYLLRSNKYTSLFAKEIEENKIPLSFLNNFKYMFLLPFLKTFLMLFRHKGILDGFPGMVFALYSGLHIRSSYIKYWEGKK
jgi:glycosyltransferase involved in cell wall biosynthesis